MAVLGYKIKYLNLGIGTTNPLAKLEVAGQYLSTKYTCTTTLNWNNGNVQYIQLANAGQTFTFANPVGGAKVYADFETALIRGSRHSYLAGNRLMALRHSSYFDCD
ncbi:MAG: hypothetical protein WC628_04390 [Candidatus Omnitrophota bacterium]